MADYICTEKIYNAKSKLIGYKVKDEHGQEKSIDTGTLKNAIRTGQIKVRNLELTDSNRLKYKPYVQYILRECYKIYSIVRPDNTLRDLKPSDYIFRHNLFDTFRSQGRIKERLDIIKEKELRPGEKVELKGYNCIVINTTNEQNVLKLGNIFDFLEERRRPGTWKKRFKKFERKRYYSGFEDIGINVFGYGTPYECKLWIDTNIYIECLAIYDGPVLYRLDGPCYLVREEKM